VDALPRGRTSGYDGQVEDADLFIDFVVAHGDVQQVPSRPDRLPCSWK
jgi:hypothetical protein